jgi:hypothetical protein
MSEISNYYHLHLIYVANSKIKTDFKREQYLYADVDKNSLSNFIKIRVSNCNLNIEKGRYLKLPVEQRICKLCHMDVEDELYNHFTYI